MKVLGLDVGGANIKASLVEHGQGKVKVIRQLSIPWELYRNPGGLLGQLEFIRKDTSAEAVALTMTGELCDVFKTRAEGARWILRQVAKAFRGVETLIVDVNGDLVTMAKARRSPMSIASANWAATLRWVAQNGFENGLVIDIGSTTTDILPVKNGKPAASGYDDHSRAMEGELVYTGYLRTNVANVLPWIKVGDKMLRACPEYFSIMGDAHLLLGNISRKDYTCPAPDGGPVTPAGAARRLLRVALLDQGEEGMETAKNIARQAVGAQEAALAEAVRKIILRERLAKTSRVLIIGRGRKIIGNVIVNKSRFELISSLGGMPDIEINPSICAALLYNM